MTNDYRHCRNKDCNSEIDIEKDRHLIIKRGSTAYHRYFCCEECLSQYIDSYKHQCSKCGSKPDVLTRFLFKERIVKVVTP